MELLDKNIMQLVKKLKLTWWSKVYLKIHRELLKNYKQSLLDWPWQYHDMSIIKNLWIDLEHAVCARQSKKYVRGWTELQGRVLKISNFRIGRFLAWLKKLFEYCRLSMSFFSLQKSVWLKFCIKLPTGKLYTFTSFFIRYTSSVGCWCKYLISQLNGRNVCMYTWMHTWSRWLAEV